MRRRGFTLIEVLVVVAVIAMLAAVLLPSLAAARKRSRAVVCLGNVRQLGVASQLYAVSWKGAFVDYGLAHGGSVDKATTWVNTLRKEYRDVLVARCPEDDSAYWTAAYPGTDQKRIVSYGVNEYLTGRLDGYERYRRLDACPRPAATILFCEMTRTGEYAVSDHVHPVNWVLNPATEAGKQIELNLHTGRSNYALADGHAEPLAFDRTFKVAGRRRDGAKLVIDWAHNMYDPAIAH